MFRTISLTAVCLILTSANSAVAQKPFKNKIALAAKKSYEEAIAQAKKEYVAKLEIAIKEAGGAGDLEEANQLAAEKERIDNSDSIEKARKRLEGIRWGKSATSWVKLLRNGRFVSRGGTTGIWLLTTPRTVVIQIDGTKRISVWNYNKQLTAAKIYSFRMVIKGKSANSSIYTNRGR